MLSRITWQQFITTLLFLLWVYYTAVLLLFYRKDALLWFAHGKSRSAETKNPASEPTKPLYTEVHELMEELKTIFAVAAKKKMIKQELVLAIQNKLKDYPQFKGTEMQVEIIQHIKNECRETCAIDLGKEESENFWKS